MYVGNTVGPIRCGGDTKEVKSNSVIIVQTILSSLNGEAISSCKRLEKQVSLYNVNVAVELEWTLAKYWKDRRNGIVCTVAYSEVEKCFARVTESQETYCTTFWPPTNAQPHKHCNEKITNNYIIWKENILIYQRLIDVYVRSITSKWYSDPWNDLWIITVWLASFPGQVTIWGTMLSVCKCTHNVVLTYNS